MYFFSYLEPVCCSMSSSNCCFLICTQISQEAGQVVWYSHLFHVQSGFRKGRGNRSNCHHLLDYQKSKRVPDKHLFLLCWLCQDLWLCGSQELWKILKEMGIPDHLICLLRNLCADQEATVRTGHGTTDWFQIGRGVIQGCILSPCLVNLYAEYIMRNAGLDKAQVESRLLG